MLQVHNVLNLIIKTKLIIMKSRTTFFVLALSFLLFLSNCGGPKEVKPIGEDDFRIFINYELGMHCTGFDFEYCCVLPPYNSIQVQVVKVGKGDHKPQLMDGYDPEDPTILVDKKTGKRYRLKYSFDDNSYSEGSKMVYWNADYDINKNGNAGETGESAANAYWNHLYIYADLEGGNPEGTSEDAKKLYIGGPKLQVPQDAGPSGQGLSGYLRNSTEKGTVVFTKSPVLDNVPIMLTNPGIWEALGLPLTAFLDSEIGGQDIKKLEEKDIQPFQVARVTLVDAETDKPVVDMQGNEVSFTGTEPIDIPNCNNCHRGGNANGQYPEILKRVKAEEDYWKSIGASDWYAQLKGTGISILSIHDAKHGTMFTKDYNPEASSNRLGRGAVLCQKCHADNVIGVLNSAKVVYKDGKVEVHDASNSDLGLPDGTPIAYLDPKNPGTPADGTLIPPLTQAIHYAHQTNRPLPDAQGRTAACQGCHPSHRFDRSMTGYPITPDGKNAYADGDNRDAAGGCYVGRDVHSNPKKDADLASSVDGLNAIGKWLEENVSNEGGKGKGLWCTNCHNNLSRELYRHDNLQAGKAFEPDSDNTIRDKGLEEIAQSLGWTMDQLVANMDPKVQPDKDGKDTGTILDTWKSAKQGRTTNAIAVIATKDGAPVVSKDSDGDILVSMLDMNPNTAAAHADQNGFAAPYEAATHGRDYWLSPGEPHCADCHKAPFTESQGGMAFPINQPGKYSLMRYSKGHSGLACQACHQSIHGLYPVTPNIDVTTYQQAASLNPDGSHGPIKCVSCHKEVNDKGVPLIAEDETYKGQKIIDNFDLAVAWMHASGKDDGGAGGKAVTAKEHNDGDGDGDEKGDK